ncbi:MAG: hypothetical protein K5930_10430 [Treponemataceae bacterium]|nr:hypothetical protein [Treponemataceae bacterium]
MAEIDKTNLPELGKNQKVELVVKREAEETAGELDLVKVFYNMGRKKGIYLWVILLFMLIGIAVQMLIVENTKDEDTVSAMISFQYPGASSGLAPDGTSLNVKYLTSSYILQQALKMTKLSENITIGSLEKNISIERLLTESTRQSLEVIQKVTELSKDGKDYSQVLNLDYKYDGRYIITLTNGFGMEKNKVYLSGNELTTLLNNIISTYDSYFFDTYKNIELPDGNLDSINNTDLDYIERLDEAVSLFISLSRYCTDQKKGSYLYYRSKNTGLSFLDYNDFIILAKDIIIDYLYAYVFANNITKGDLTTVTKYKYNLQNTERTFNSVLTIIKNNEQLLREYKNDSIAVSKQEEGVDTISSSVTDYYNNLIMDQVSNYTRKADLGEQIANLKYKIAGFEEIDRNQEWISYTESAMEDITETCNVLFELIRHHATEIIESTTYKASYMHYIEAQDTGSSIFNAENIKKVLIGLAIGLFLAVIIWGMDGLIEEMKRSSPQKKEKSEEKRQA